MIEQIDKRIARALGSIRKAFRGVVTLVKTSGNVQLMQVKGMAGETLQDAEYFQHWGLATNPPAGSMAIVLPIGGKTAHGIIIATEHGTYRLKNLKSGEVALYDDQGQVIHLKRNGILIDTPFDFECRAKNIKLHATDSYTFDVNGQGQRWDGEGVETWQDDDQPKPHHNHAPPEVS